MPPRTLGTHGIGGINASGQVPKINGNFGLIDPDTPSSALHYTTHKDGKTWDLVFSDEFNVENRTFYPVGIFHFRGAIHLSLLCREMIPTGRGLT